MAGIMDELRMLAYDRDLVRKDAPFAKILKYNADSFERWGRMYELELLARDKITRPSSMTDDLMLGAKMVMKGKIGFMPSRGGDRAQMKRMVEAAERIEKKRAWPARGSRHASGAGEGGDRMTALAYYPGCSLHSTATEMDESFKATCARARPGAPRDPRLGVLRQHRGALDEPPARRRPAGQRARQGQGGHEARRRGRALRRLLQPLHDRDPRGRPRTPTWRPT